MDQPLLSFISIHHLVRSPCRPVPQAITSGSYICIRSLQDLQAGTNQIHEVSTIPTQLPVLEVLDLTNNDITDWDEFVSYGLQDELIFLFEHKSTFFSQYNIVVHKLKISGL